MFCFLPEDGPGPKIWNWKCLVGVLQLYSNRWAGVVFCLYFDNVFVAAMEFAHLKRNYNKNPHKISKSVRVRVPSQRTQGKPLKCGVAL